MAVAGGLEGQDGCLGALGVRGLTGERGSEARQMGGEGFLTDGRWGWSVWPQ